MLKKSLYLLSTILLLASTAQADDAKENNFISYDNTSKLTIDYSDLDQMYSSSVLWMGMSNRGMSGKTIPGTHTRLRAKRNRHTYFEGTRLPMLSFGLPENQAVFKRTRESLQSIPDYVPLTRLSKKEQIAYWINLYNLTFIEKMSKTPLGHIKQSLYGPDSFLDEKIIRVSGQDLSLNDIQFDIVYAGLGDHNPLLMYGFYQGVIGSPNMAKKAYTGKNLFQQLRNHANEFINSNRGTFNRRKMKVSWFYEHNSILFPNFQEDLKTHLMKYTSGGMKERIRSANRLYPQLASFNRADYQSGEMMFGKATNGRAADGSLLDFPDLDYFLEMKRRFDRKILDVTIEEVSSDDE